MICTHDTFRSAILSLHNTRAAHETEKTIINGGSIRHYDKPLCIKMRISLRVSSLFCEFDMYSDKKEHAHKLTMMMQWLRPGTTKQNGWNSENDTSNHSYVPPARTKKVKKAVFEELVDRQGESLVSQPWSSSMPVHSQPNIVVVNSTHTTHQSNAAITICTVFTAS